MDSFNKSEVIFHQGDTGVLFYIILKGQVAVFIDLPSDNFQGRKLKEVLRLKAGKTFGEIALMRENQKRTATIVAIEDTTVILIDRKSFTKYIMRKTDTSLSKMIEFYEDCPMFKKLPKKSLIKLASSSEIKTFPSNTLVLKQGDDAQKFIFIKRGQFKLMRKIGFMIDPENDTISTSDFSEPTEEDYKHEIATKVILQLNTVGRNFCLCDYEIFFKQKMKYTAITSMPSEIIKISNFSLKTILNTMSGSLAAFKDQAKPYPPDKELRKQFIEKQKWELYKHQTLMNTFIRSKIQSNSVDDNMREPLIAEIGYDIQFHGTKSQNTDSKIINE